MALRTVGNGSSLPIVSTAQTSAAFTVQSNVVKIVAKGAGAHVKIDSTAFPAATTSDFYVHAGGVGESLAQTKGSQRVVGITTGATTILEAPEGTAMPFHVGEFVTLDTANDANYTTILNHVEVTAVQQHIPTFDGSGLSRSNITVSANTSGIITAFNSASHATVSRSHKISCVAATGEGTGVLHFQQVQTTGSA